MSIGIILYARPEHYPPTTNLIRLLQKKYRVYVFSRNMGTMEDSFPPNVYCYRFWKKSSVMQRERAFLLLKLIEYVFFVISTVLYASKHNCKVIIAYDCYALLPALILKTLNKKIDIFYNPHEIDTMQNRKWNTLSCWIQNIVYKNLHKCSWISQPDKMRVEYFQNLFHLDNVRLLRNFALKDIANSKDKNDLCSKYKDDGYTIMGYLGTIGNEFYLDELINYIKNTELKILIALAGNVRDSSVLAKLTELNNRNTIGKIIYMGCLYGDEKYAFLNSVDVGLILYKFKAGMVEMSGGASNKVGEYLAFGKPLIYPKWWEYESFYKEVGLEYKDGNELISKIERLVVNSELRNELGENARRLFNEYINFENESKVMRELVDKCMDANHGK